MLELITLQPLNTPILRHFQKILVTPKSHIKTTFVQHPTVKVNPYKSQPPRRILNLNHISIKNFVKQSIQMFRTDTV